jgi:hypothetical protein
MLAKRQTTVPVTLKALMARINRKLKADNEVLKAARSPKVAARIGAFFVVRANTIVTQQVDPEAFGRELGVLNDWEHLET